MAILTKLIKKDFESILKNYDIGKCKNHKHLSHALGNTIYVLKTIKGTFILKIFENAGLDFIKFQIKLIKTIEKNKLPVPKIIRTRIGEDLFIYKKNRIIMQEFIDGKPPKKINLKLLKNIAKIHSEMDNYLSKIKLTGKYTWGKDYQFKPLEFDVKKFENFNIIEEDKKIIQELKTIDKTKLRKSVIHGDYHGVNLLVKNQNVVAILDWDDAHEDFLVQDLVAFISHAFKESLDLKGLGIYIKEYQKKMPLRLEEKKVIYPFVKKRYLAAISWHVIQLKKHKDIGEKITKHIKWMIKQYKEFEKISPKDFLDMLK